MAAAEPRKPKAPRPPARQPAPLPPLATTNTTTYGDGDSVGDENNDPARPRTDQRSFIQLTDNKLFANESSNC